MSTHVPPHAIEAETAVLGAVFIQNTALEEAAQLVFPPDFYRTAHQVIYRHMLALAEKRQPIDFTTLQDSLTRTKELDAVGGMLYLSELVNGLPHATNIAHYARIVREKAALREIITAATATLESAYRAESDASAVLDGAQQAFFGIATHSTARGLVSASELASELIDTLEVLQRHRGPVTGVPSGLTDLDLLTAGFQKGDLILLAARPSMGKTALALGAAFHAATIAKRHVAIFSLEMSRTQLGLRMLGAHAQIDGHRLRTGQIWEAEHPRIARALCELGDAWLHIDDASTITIHQLRARSRQLKATVGLDLIVIDYLQLMEGTKAENRNLEVAGLSRALKAVARDLDVPVLALSQLSRSLESRQEKRPELSDLRDSGALEQDSDVVMFLYRNDVYKDDPDQKGIAELWVKKQRNGPIGMAKVLFEAHTTTFHNLSLRQEQPA